MKKTISLIALMASAGSLAAQSNVTILSEDFESGGNNLNRGNNALDLTLVPNPAAGGTGTVGQGDSGEVASQWGALNAVPQTIPLPAGAEPGVSTFTISMQVYIPSDSTFQDNDRMGVIVRWNGLQTSANSNYQEISTFARDTWETISVSGIIPAVDGNGNPVTEAFPIISFNDRDDDAATGVSAYIDDYSFEVSVSSDDPNFNTPAEFAFGEVDQNGGEVTREFLLTNGGATQTLTITEATLSGTNADLFSLSDLNLPLQIAPGESERLLITIDPGDNLGFLTADLDFTSTDPSTPMSTTVLRANSVEPFVGLELVMNGDFETGNLEGWREDNRFTWSDAQARSGTGSGSFTMAAGQQWGEARTNNQFVPEIGSIEITPEMIGKDYAYSAWYFRPSTGGPADDDTVQVIFRWNGKNGATNHSYGLRNVGDIPTDLWTRAKGRNVIPALDLDGLPVTHVIPLWSFRDVGSNSAGTETMYLDDISIKVDVPFVVPAVTPTISNLVIDRENDIVSFEYVATPGREYRIERSTTMLPTGEPGGWLELDDPTATAEIESFSDTGALGTSSVFFYRVRLVEE
jgi:hypothetical protein